MNKESFVLYFSGLLQGLALVAFPSASSIFTSPDAFHFSNTEYGSLFVPQAIFSIIGSLLFVKIKKIKPVFLCGLFANFLAMVLLAASSFVMKDKSLAYPLLLLATGSLGLGFGLTVPSLNIFASEFFRKKVDRAVLILNALLGLGTALSPMFIAFFVDLGLWWGFPFLLAFALLATLFLSYFLPFKTQDKQKGALKTLPFLFWLFAVFAFLYGMVETINGNWAIIFTKNVGHGSAKAAALSLTAFWAFITVGRVFFASIEKFFSERNAFRCLPFLTAVSFFFTAEFPHLGWIVFALAGFGCSALLPLTLSFAAKKFSSIKPQVTGGLIAFYLLGYGVSAFGVGPLQDLTGLNLKTIFLLSAVISLMLGVLSMFVISKGKI